MNGINVTITDMMNCRDRRVSIQNELINKYDEPSGDELIMALDAPAEDIKTLATEIEESHPLGRLFDMDVIGTDGMKLSRGTYRKCIICGCQAQECARSRKHSVEELQAKIEDLLNRFCV